MGGQQSKQTNEDKDQMPKVNHPRFGNLRFTRNKDDEDCIEVKLPVANQKQYNQWVAALKDAPIQTQDFLLPQKHQFQKEGFCGSSGYVKILFDNFPYVLADQIRNRACLKQKFFDETELWYLIYTLISAGHQFHKNGKKVGDVRPQNVFINEDGQVKVATQLTWPSENTNYHKTFYEKQLTYLAPQELKDIQFAKMEPSCNPKLAQSFSIGLTCLDAGTLTSSNSLYLKNNKFSYNDLGNKLQDLRAAGYSDVLCLVVSNLCEPDFERRSTCSELFKWLQPYQESIINLQKFQATTFPEKLAQFGAAEQYPTPPRQNQGVRPGSLPQGQTVTYDSRYQNVPHQGLPPQGETVTYSRAQNVPQGQPGQSIQSSTYVSSGGNYPVPSAPYGQTVYYSQPPPPQVIQNPQGVYQPQTQKTVIYQGPPQNLQGYQQQTYPPYTVVQQPQGPISNQNKTTTSSYTYTQYPPTTQYNPSNPSPQFNQNSGQTYTSQTVQYTRTAQPGYQADTGAGDRPKSNMQLTLQKIDEQLQMSRKMFPS